MTFKLLQAPAVVAHDLGLALLATTSGRTPANGSVKVTASRCRLARLASIRLSSMCSRGAGGTPAMSGVQWARALAHPVRPEVYTLSLQAVGAPPRPGPCGRQVQSLFRVVLGGSAQGHLASCKCRPGLRVGRFGHGGGRIVEEQDEAGLGLPSQEQGWKRKAEAGRPGADANEKA
jgi:hypothetical protein